MSALRNNQKTPKKTTNRNTPAPKQSSRDKLSDNPVSPLSPVPKTPATSHHRKKSTVENGGDKKKDVPVGPKPSDDLEGYTQRQEDELSAIQSIYGSAVQLVEKKGAWNTSAIAFVLHLSANNDLISCSCNLYVEFTATYPATSPILELRECQGLLPAEKTALERILKDALKTTDQELVYEVASAIELQLQDIVESDQNTRNTSLLTTHDLAIQEAEEQAKQEARERDNEERKTQLEEESHMRDMVKLAENKRRAAKEKKSKPVDTLSEETFAMPESVVFDRAIDLSEGGDNYRFRRCMKLREVSKKSNAKVYSVRPVVNGSTDNSLVLALKVLHLPDYNLPSSEGKSKIHKLEAELDKLRKLKNTNLANVLEFAVEQSDAGSISEFPTWKISILSAYGDRGTLREMIDLIGTVRDEVARSWGMQILDGLEYLHHHGFAHGRLQASNILLQQNHSTVVKIGDVGYHLLLEHFEPSERPQLFPVPYHGHWIAPEKVDGKYTPKDHASKADIWGFGIILEEMLFGLNVTKNYSSPAMVANSKNLSDSYLELHQDIFKSNPRDRPSASQVMQYDFFRSKDPALAPSDESADDRYLSVGASTMSGRGRHNSVVAIDRPPDRNLSRYEEEFIEYGKIGKGAFGSVFTARHRVDKRMYAIKKIVNQTSNLREVMQEVALLSKLNHQNIVRYYGSWLEYPDAVNGGSSSHDMDGSAVFSDDDDGESDGSYSESGSVVMESATGLDIVNSTTYSIQFGYSSDEEENDGDDDEDDEDEDEDEDEDTESSDEDGEEAEEDKGDTDDAVQELESNASVIFAHSKAHPEISESSLFEAENNALERKRTQEERKTNILYIQMELCENETLRTMISSGLYQNEETIWRIFHQILEGLVHIHHQGIIHRDLKPDNIFMDEFGSPRIGDFGLATSGQIQKTEGVETTYNELTEQVGTALYVAPELIGEGRLKYSNKVDMYSLGIILLEMVTKFDTLMERAFTIQAAREKDIKLPESLKGDEHCLKREIITSLLDHDEKKRPSSKELISNGKLPTAGMDVAFERALKAVSQKGSDIHNKVVNALFKQHNESHLDFVYDIENGDELQDQGYESLLTKAMVRSRLCTVFRRHGAVETHRPAMIPRNNIYKIKVLEVVDSNGNKLMLPYDLVLSHARLLARKGVHASNPIAYSEAGFDIVSTDATDLALQEAEVIKVISEVMNTLAFVKPSKCLIHINHGALLELILEFCRIPTELRHDTKECLSKLHIAGYAWDTITSELRQVGVATTSLDDLSKFDWRDDYETAFEKLKRLFKPGVRSDRYTPIFSHISSVMTYLSRLSLTHKIFLNPLGTLNHSFYQNGLMFQCVFEASSNAREVAAAGGRYDQLILDHKPAVTREDLKEVHAVGFHMPLKLLYSMAIEYGRSVAKARSSKKNGDYAASLTDAHRIDVVVASFDRDTLRNQGLQLLQELWAANIAAELAIDTTRAEKLVQHYKGTGVSTVIIVKAPQTHASIAECHFKIRDLTNQKKEEMEVKYTQIIGTVEAEIRSRHSRVAAVGHGSGGAGGRGKRSSSGKEGFNVYPVLPEKKNSNRKVQRQVQAVDIAQAKTTAYLSTLSHLPILTIDLPPDLFETLRTSASLLLKDAEAWKKQILNKVNAAERAYVGEIRDALGGFLREGKKSVVVHNSRGGEVGVVNL